MKKRTSSVPPIRRIITAKAAKHIRDIIANNGEILVKASKSSFSRWFCTSQSNSLHHFLE